MSNDFASYAPGDRVRLVDGPLSNFEAIVQAVDTEPYQLRLAVAVKGLSVPVRTEAWQVEKIG